MQPEPESQGETRPAPRVWVLLGQGTGGNGQLCSLADALGWPCTLKRIAYNPAHLVPNLLLGASRLSVDLRRSDPLEPPWPDLVIAASRRSAPLARWIKRRSGGRTRLVHLLHAQAPLDDFDLVLTLPQYRLPARPNVVEFVGAFNRPDPAALAAAATAWRERLAPLPRPWIALLVGGNSSSYRLTPQVARRLAREASDAARSAGGSLLVSTTPRTPDDAADALFQGLTCPHHAYRFQRDDPDNPYAAYLALADRFIVTVDSASLPMEACATGRPVQVFEWPRRGRAPRPLRGLRRRWVEYGLIKPARDFDAYHRALRERGLVARLGETLPKPGRLPDDLERAVTRVRALFATDAR